MNQDFSVAPLDVGQAAFLGGPVSMNVASRDANGVPSVARAFGCRLSADRRRLTVFLPCAQSCAVLDDLRAGGPVSVVFSRPTTHRTLQIKGSGVSVDPLARGDRDLMRDYGARFGDEIRDLSFSEAFVLGMVSGIREDAVAASFTPLAVFDQTPGPGAGRRLDTGS